MDLQNKLSSQRKLSCSGLRILPPNLMSSLEETNYSRVQSDNYNHGEQGFQVEDLASPIKPDFELNSPNVLNSPQVSPQALTIQGLSSILLKVEVDQQLQRRRTQFHESLQISNPLCFASVIDAFYENNNEDEQPIDTPNKTEEEDFDTGVMEASSKTQFQILSGFWVQGDYLAFLTFDVLKNEICIEVFHYEQGQLKPVLCKVLCSRGSFDSWRTKIDTQRKNIVFFVYKWNDDSTGDVASETTDKRIAGFFITISELAHNPESESIFEIDTSSLREMMLDKMLSSIWLLLEEKQSSQSSFELRLVLVYSQLGEKLVRKAHMQAKVQLKTWYSLFDCKFRHVFSEDDEHNIIGFALVTPHHGIVVYSSGEIRHLHLLEIGKKKMLKHKLGKIKTCQFTSHSHPRLVLQSEDLSIGVFDYIDKWTQTISLAGVQFGLVNAFGNFLITQHSGSTGLKLIEIQSDKKNPITTVLQLSNSNKTSYVDSCLLDNMSYLRLTRNGTDFDFKKISQQRCIFHTADGFLEYACGDIIFSLAYDCSCIMLKKELVNIQSQFTSAEIILMPKLPINSIESFKVYQCRNSHTYLIAIKPIIQSGDFTTQKQYLFFCNTVRKSIVEVKAELQLPITTFLFLKKRTLICQNATTITECVLRKKEDSFVLEQVKGSIQLDLGYTRLQAFQYLEYHDDGTLLLFIDKIMTSSHEKIIYAIPLSQVRATQSSNIENSKDINKYIEVAFILQTKLSSADEAFSVKSEQKVRAIYCPRTDMGFAIVASGDFALLYRLKYKGENCVKVDCCQALTIRNAESLLMINSEQLAIFSQIDVIVVRVSGRNFEKPQQEIKPKILIHEIDFKIFFKHSIRHISVSQNIMAVQYGCSSLLLIVGEPASSAPKSVLEVMQTKMSSFNMVSASFKRCLKIYGLDGYISIQEHGAHWNEETPYTIINVHSPDLLTIKPSFFDGDQEQSFDETIMVQNVYLNKFTIWEGIIRDALADRRVEITQFQLPRVLRPVLGDYNRNLIHHLSENKFDMLQQILEMPEVELFYAQHLTKTPIFFDFFGQNQMQIAIDARDNECFYLLMELMLKHQNNVLNSYLVNPFLIKVMEQGLDVSKLLDSNICSYKLEPQLIEHFKTFASFHSNGESQIVNYEGTLMELSHDEDAYNKMFGEKFPFQRFAKTQLMYAVTLFSKKKAGLLTKTNLGSFPIEYIAYRFPIAYDHDNLQQNSEEIHHLLEILTSTEQTSYLRTAYVQRLIDYQWSGNLKKAYSIILAFSLTEFVLILISSVCLNLSDEKIGSDVRAVLSMINVVLIIISVGVFEARQLIKSGLSYFKSKWNINDFLFFCIGLALPILEILYNIYLRDQYALASEEITTTTDTTTESTLRFLKPKKRPKSGNQKTVVTDAGPLNIDVEDTLLQVLRIMYVCLILSGFFKVLYIAQIFPNVGYLLKMLSRICRAAVPFLMFFVYLNVTFTFVIQVIHISFDETATKVFMGEYQGYNLQVMAYLMYAIRNSLGDTKVDTFLFLPQPLMYIAWVMWFLLFAINSMIFLNFLIATIEEQYNHTKINRVEESYRNKATILLDLDDVFGSYIDLKPVNILVLRHPIERPELPEGSNMLSNLKAQMIQQQTTLNTALHFVKKDINELKHEENETHKHFLNEVRSFSNDLERILNGLDRSQSVQLVVEDSIDGPQMPKSDEDVESFRSDSSCQEAVGFDAE